MVGAGLEVAARLDPEAEAAVAGEQVEHVVEEADAGRGARLSPVEVERERDLRLGGAALLCSCAAHSVILLGPDHRGLAVDGQALGAGQSCRRAAPASPPPRRESRRSRSCGGTCRAQRPGEAPGAAGRQHVVGAGGVVAEGGRAVAARRRRSRPSSTALGEQRRVLLDQLEVLGREGVGEVDRVAGVGDLDQRQRRVVDARPLGGDALGRLGDRVEHAPPRRRRRPAAVGAVLGLRAEVERDPLGVGVVAGDHHQLGGAGERVDPDPPGDAAASPLGPRRCPGPTTTSTGAIVSVP